MQIKLDKYLEKKQICNQARQMIREKTNMQIRQNKKRKEEEIKCKLNHKFSQALTQDPPGYTSLSKSYVEKAWLLW